MPRLGPTLGPSLSGMSLTCFDHLGSSFPLAYLSIDVTGALVPYPPKCMVFGLSFLCTCVSVRRRDRCTRTPIIHFLFGARPFPLSSHRFAFCLTLVERTMLCSNFVGAALCLFGGLVVPCLCCPPGLVRFCCFCAPVGAPRFLSGFVVLLSVLVWALLLSLLSALLCGGSFLCPLCLPSPAGCLVWCSGPACTLACWYLPLGIWLQL